MDNKELFEKLAAIEHERWADWQKYVHQKCSPIFEKGQLKGLLIPAELVLQWERQISTLYKDLTETEKEKDHEQVRRYWHLISPTQEDPQ